MDRRSFYSIFDSAYPPELSCSWDNDGVMVCRDMDREVSRVLVCLDVTVPVVKSAIEGGFDVIVSHHPLLFNGVKRLDGGSAAGKKLFDLAAHDVAVFSFHTRMDAAPNGLNRAVAEALGLTSLSPLELPGENGSVALSGNVPLSDPAAFARAVAHRFGSPVTLWQAKERVSRAVCVCGGGKDLLYPVLQSGAELFITGDLAYNGVLEAVEAGMSVLELPHRASELLCLDVFWALISEKAPSVFVEKCPLGGESRFFLP